MRRLLLALALALLAAAVALPAAAEELRGLIDALGRGTFADREKAIAALAGSGEPAAAPVIEALGAGNLYVRTGDGAVLLARGSALVDPLTNAAAGSVSDSGIERIRVNNRLRRAIDAALGSLTLLSPDPATRLEAAAAVFKSRDPGALPTLEKALAAETNPEVAAALGEARAAALLFSDASEAEKLEAVKVIRARGDREALSLLGMVAAQGPGPVADAASSGVRAIERVLAVWEAGQNVWYGLSLGSVLLLAAIGLAITFGVMGVINMAHGEMVMLGAYTTFVVQEAIRSTAPWLFDASLLVALPLAFLVAGAVGIAIERGIIRFLYGRPLETLLATWGLSLILQQGVRSIFGPTNREVGAPSWMSGWFEIGHLTITHNRLWIIAFALLVFAGLSLVLRRTSFGLQMRAVVQNRNMASAMGIRTPWIDALTFGLGSSIAGIAGVALSQIDNVSPNLGQGYIIDSFMVVVFGGVGNLWGTLFGAAALGIVNKFLEPYAGAVLGKILVLVFIIIFIQKRPRGLFALKGRAVEA
ncbi:MAG: urea ABC transporter permease subunit UrtB [Rhodospirillales bacterium]|nr:urea ABC transporter permease subunit UrtB [Rhodospirillales bacterium]